MLPSWTKTLQNVKNESKKNEKLGKNKNCQTKII